LTSAVDGPNSALVIGERRALRDDVREALVNAVLAGEFAPGERIVETRVARQLGSAKAPSARRSARSRSSA
jgi:DNA-binding GntR family transcriptional regulator